LLFYKNQVFFLQTDSLDAFLRVENMVKYNKSQDPQSPENERENAKIPEQNFVR
jgi:hypothetical protein